MWAPGKTKVLIVAGGSAHNFGKFFGETDTATLTAAGFSVNYTEDRDQAAAELSKADVASGPSHTGSMLSVADVIERARAVLVARGDAIAAAYLFGSVARGTATSDPFVASVRRWLVGSWPIEEPGQGPAPVGGNNQ